MEPKVGLALGGGAARGLAHLGVLKVLEEANIPFHIITGTSFGALIGGLYASRPDAAYWMRRVEQFLRNFGSRKNSLEFVCRLEQSADDCQGFFTDMANLLRKGYFWGVTATKPAFISEKEYEEFLYPLIPDIAIEETMLPFGCVATDIRNAVRVLYTSGSLRRAISASCALPGIFPPVSDDDRLLVDGGWLECLPARSAREMGAQVVIGVDVSSEVHRFMSGSGMDIVLRADAVTRIYLNDLLLADADVLIHPNVGQCQWADFSNFRELFREGQKAAEEKLPAIRRAMQKGPVAWKTLIDRLKTIRRKMITTLGKGKVRDEA
jgi:NTE family protein